MSKTENQLLKSVREFYQGVAEEDKKLVNQFTEKGLDLLVEYYNNKYPDRGQIHRVQAAVVLGVEDEKFWDKARFDAIAGISKARQENELPLKIMLTYLQKETADSEPLVERGRHSIPLLLTSDKLIMLREEGLGRDKNLEKIAQGLNVSLIQQREPAVKPAAQEGKKPKRTSIQADHSNCNGIAVGILKDLTTDDLHKVAGFEDGYVPLPKMLKYSQSGEFVKMTYPELVDQPVKFDERGNAKSSLIDYIAAGKEAGLSRITTKMDKMREDMSELKNENNRSWAQEILENRIQAKSKQNESKER
jgi:hypothetical protein